MNQYFMSLYDVLNYIRFNVLYIIILGINYVYHCMESPELLDIPFTIFRTRFQSGTINFFFLNLNVFSKCHCPMFSQVLNLGRKYFNKMVQAFDSVW